MSSISLSCLNIILLLIQFLGTSIKFFSTVNVLSRNKSLGSAGFQNVKIGSDEYVSEDAAKDRVARINLWT